ncbi:MAG: MMPL family transporter [Polyangiaceae bacterium]|nr:MMPL family transporter [Polyangiaceae bacterium]
MKSASSSSVVIRERLIAVLVVVVTAIAGLLIATRVRLNPDVVALLPSRGDAAALGRYIRGFGGGGVSVLLIEGPDPEENAAIALKTADALRNDPTIAFASAKLEMGKAPEPLLIWRIADAGARERLAAALTPEGMRERLTESRTLLSAPGAAGMSEMIANDPLRLNEIVLGGERAVSSGVRTRTDGFFANEDGTSHLVVVKPKGQALRGSEARAFEKTLETILEPIRKEHANVSIRATGPHIVAAQMEAMLRKDLETSGILSGVFASIAFAIVFRRLRALIAILPPLALGTLWTAALAAFWPGGISAIAVAFTSVVVGVGFDTGVHVYAALLEGRRQGLSPSDAARAARAHVARPVLVAALIAAVAFASMALSSVEALQQLGLLCAAGEILTALAIVAVTPGLGAWLERSDPPAETKHRAFRWIAGLTRTRGRAALAVGISLVLGASVFVSGVHISDSLVAVRPSKLDALDVEKRIFEVFGGRPQPWIVMVADGSQGDSMRRADALAETLAKKTDVVNRVDALVSVVPSEATQRARLAERDALDLPAKATELERALEQTGFRPARFTAVLDAMRAPPNEIASPADLLAGDLGVLGARYLAEDGGEHLAALHVHLRDGTVPATFKTLVAEIDPGASVTGYARLETDLKEALGRDLPRIALVAGGLVIVLLAISLRRAREVAIAALVLVTGIGALLAIAAQIGIPLHIYSALVVPVLLGISVDEAMFLLHRAREITSGDPVEEALVTQGKPVVTTALTTSAGFVALAMCGYEGLRHLGYVGALGNAITLVIALVLVPAGLRLFTPKR